MICENQKTPHFRAAFYCIELENYFGGIPNKFGINSAIGFYAAKGL